MQELSEMKAYLKKKWMQVYKKHKKLKQLKEEKKESDSPKRDKEKFDIPYIPKDIDTGDQARDLFITKFVTKLQAPHQKDASGNLVDLGRETLLQAVDVAVALESSIHQWSKKENERKEKFMQVMSILIA